MVDTSMMKWHLYAQKCYFNSFFINKIFSKRKQTYKMTNINTRSRDKYFTFVVYIRSQPQLSDETQRLLRFI